MFFVPDFSHLIILDHSVAEDFGIQSRMEIRFDQINNVQYPVLNLKFIYEQLKIYSLFHSTSTSLIDITQVNNIDNLNYYQLILQAMTRFIKLEELNFSFIDNVEPSIIETFIILFKENYVDPFLKANNYLPIFSFVVSTNFEMFMIDRIVRQHFNGDHYNQISIHYYLQEEDECLDYSEELEERYDPLSTSMNVNSDLMEIEEPEQVITHSPFIHRRK